MRHWAFVPRPPRRCAATSAAPAPLAETRPLEADVPAALLAAVEETHEVVNELPLPAEAIGLLGFGALVALLLVTYAFRSVGSRH